MKTGKILIQPIEGYLSWISENYLLACRCRRNKRDVAIFNKDGKQLTDYIYEEDDAYWFDELKDNYSLFILKKDGKMGVIDSANKLIIPFEYDEIKFTAYNERFACKKGESVQCLMLNGEIAGDPCPVEKHYPKPIKTDTVSYLCNAWQDSTGMIYSLPHLYEAGWFYNSYAVFSIKSQKDGMFSYHKGIVNENFKVIIPAKYYSIGSVEKNGLAFVKAQPLVDTTYRFKEGKTGYIDMYGTEYWED
jgi:hypothetical protein